MWTCPRCDRSFGRANRAHVCEAGMPVEVWLEQQAEPQRRAAEAVIAIARWQPDVVIEAVGVGVLIKRERTIVELRPKQRWLDLSFVSAAAIASTRFARVIELARGRAYFVHLRDERDVDGELRRWIAAALRVSSGTKRRR